MLERLRRYPDSRIAAGARAFPSVAGTVASGGSPHTVARPCRPHTGFPRKRRIAIAQRSPPSFLRTRQVCRLFASHARCALLAACAAPPRTAPRAARHGARVVTLVPSFADDVYAIGAGAQLVAVSAFTDAPRAGRCRASPTRAASMPRRSSRCVPRSSSAFRRRRARRTACVAPAFAVVLLPTTATTRSSRISARSARSPDTPRRRRPRSRACSARPRCCTQRTRGYRAASERLRRARQRLRFGPRARRRTSPR